MLKGIPEDSGMLTSDMRIVSYLPLSHIAGL
jgi:long-chain-fatty-acid--CoA ligase ACSBG